MRGVRPLEGGGTVCLAFGDQCHLHVHSTRSFGPGGQWAGGGTEHLPIVVVVLGACTADVGGLLHVFSDACFCAAWDIPWHRESVRGACPLDVVAGSVPSRHCIGIG